MKTIRFYLVVLIFIFLAPSLSAQDFSSDEYFQMARKEAFNNHNYPGAIRLSNLALQQSPAYIDILVFLGRVYYWNNQPDSSLLVLKTALEKKPGNEDASIAISDIEYYEEHYASSLRYIEMGLEQNPSSKELLIRKAKCLAALSRYKEAFIITDSILLADPKNGPARSLASKIQDQRSKNKIGISYDYIYFDKQFSDPWHLMSLDYSRQTKAGSLIGRVNYANRFSTNGVQFEIDAYPHISKTFYAYTNIGYSPSLPVFPKFRAGFSLYANLPLSFEVDAGFRYLRFNGDTWIYTVSVGKYYRNFWFNGRTYLTPSNNRISQSYTLTARYYLKGATDYLSFNIGSGISPDDRSLTVQLNNPYRLQTKKIGGAYRFTVKQMNIFTLSASFDNVEYLPKTTGNQVGLSVGYMRRF